MEEHKMDYTCDSFGNIVELAGKLKGYNIITMNDDLGVVKEKKKKQLEMLAELRKEQSAE